MAILALTTKVKEITNKQTIRGKIISNEKSSNNINNTNERLGKVTVTCELKLFNK